MYPFYTGDPLINGLFGIDGGRGVVPLKTRVQEVPVLYVLLYVILILCTVVFVNPSD